MCSKKLPRGLHAWQVHQLENVQGVPMLMKALDVRHPYGHTIMMSTGCVINKEKCTYETPCNVRH